MDRDTRRPLLLAAILALAICSGVAFVTFGSDLSAASTEFAGNAGLVVSDGSDREAIRPDESQLVTVNESSLWPYTSRRPSTQGRTLAINMIVHGDPDVVRRYLMRNTDGNWTTESEPSIEEDDAPVPPGANYGPEWERAHGATRYTYVESADGLDSAWLTESYQLYDGTYLGSRQHIRAYVAPQPYANWTAMQAHAEYWDWFRLRHTVTGIAGSQRYVESDFMSDSAPASVHRQQLGNGGTSNGDGWATIVNFAAVVVAFGSIRTVLGRSDSVAAALREPLFAVGWSGVRRVGLLVGSIVALYLGIRVGGVTLETTFPGTSPKVIAAVLYPLLVAGLPICAWYLAARLELEDAFFLAVTGLVGAFLLEAMYLDIAAVPVRLVFHRVALVLSLGLVAAGSSYRMRGAPVWNTLTRFGVGGWVLALLFPLLGII